MGIWLIGGGGDATARSFAEYCIVTRLFAKRSLAQRRGSIRLPRADPTGSHPPSVRKTPGWFRCPASGRGHEVRLVSGRVATSRGSRTAQHSIPCGIPQRASRSPCIASAVATAEKSRPAWLSAALRCSADDSAAKADAAAPVANPVCTPVDSSGGE